MDPHMQMTSTQEMERLIAFTRKAAEVLRDNNNLVTFTDGDIEPGCLFGVRWGIGGDCLLILKIDEFAPIINMQQALR